MKKIGKIEQSLQEDILTARRGIDNLYWELERAARDLAEKKAAYIAAQSKHDKLLNKKAKTEDFLGESLEKKQSFDKMRFNSKKAAQKFR